MTEQRRPGKYPVEMRERAVRGHGSRSAMDPHADARVNTVGNDEVATYP